MRQLGEQLVEDRGVGDDPLDNFIAYEEHFVQQHVSRAAEERDSISVRPDKSRRHISREKVAFYGALWMLRDLGNPVCYRS
ncbi:hypothetical protein [Bradyrhizobium lablabi]|uniref:hypothetical protein n=1 Tax=Bradyrhizobium lablabi TaxID=722472 RepID=UPI001BA9F6D7|nr:hypothetical protein [Bradyrhizobium lablabi]MBR0697846.1 hypothetical protein [Bradyrhizobium lablabi]